MVTWKHLISLLVYIREYDTIKVDIHHEKRETEYVVWPLYEGSDLHCYVKNKHAVLWDLTFSRWWLRRSLSSLM
jgi:hypothetical protein